MKPSLSNAELPKPAYHPHGAMEYVQKFADFVETGDVNTRLKPKYNLN